MMPRRVLVQWNLDVIEKLQHFCLDFKATYNDMAYKKGPLVSPQYGGYPLSVS